MFAILSKYLVQKGRQSHVYLTEGEKHGRLLMLFYAAYALFLACSNSMTAAE